MMWLFIWKFFWKYGQLVTWFIQNLIGLVVLELICQIILVNLSSYLKHSKVTFQLLSSI